MISWLNLLWMLLSVSLMAWMIGNLISLLVSTLPTTRDINRERRRLWALASLPVALPLACLFALISSATAKALNVIDDHCFEHFQHHPHFCFEHLPDIAIAASHSLPVIAASASLLILVTYSACIQISQHRRGSLLRRLMPLKSRLKRVPDSRPLAFVLGIREPTIFLSEGLYRLLSKRQQRLVLAHETAHIRNFDVIKNVIFELLLSLHLRRRTLRRRWRLSTELLADAQVARRFDRFELAKVIIDLERSRKNQLQPVSIYGSDTQMRVKQLIEPVTMTAPARFEWLIYTLSLAIPVMAAIHHHALETLLGWWLK